MDPSQYPLYENEFSNGLVVSIPLYTGGRLENQREAARYHLNSADLELESVRQQVRYRAQAACYEYLQRRDLIHVWEQALITTKEHLDQVQIRYDVGTVAYSDLLASEVELANQQQSLVTAQGNFQKAMQTLNNIIGLPVDTFIDLKGDLQEFSFELPNLESCTEYALRYRPDSIADEYNVKRMEANREAAKAANRPTVNAVASNNFSGERAFRKNHSETWALGLNLEWNIFDNGVTNAQVRQLDAQILNDTELTTQGGFLDFPDEKIMPIADLIAQQDPYLTDIFAQLNLINIFSSKPTWEYQTWSKWASSSNKEYLKKLLAHAKSHGYRPLIRDSSHLGFSSYHVVIPRIHNIYPVSMIRVREFFFAT